MKRCARLLLILLLCTSLYVSSVKAELTPTPTPQVLPSPVFKGTSVRVEIPSFTGNLRLTGFTSPFSQITFVRDNVIVGTTVAEGGGYFDKTLTGLNPGNATYGIFSTDVYIRSTSTVSRDIMVFEGVPATADPITLPPTFTITRKPHKRTEPQIIQGMGRPSSSASMMIDNAAPNPLGHPINASGQWEANITTTFRLGIHRVKALVQNSGGAISEFSTEENFETVISADLNVDAKTDLVDFSILMFYYGRLPYTNIPSDINDDGPIDLVDFSIMMFYWTG